MAKKKEVTLEELGVIRLTEEFVRNDLEVVPSGSIALDHALKIGGFPMGRVVMVYGPESSGKTTLAQHVIANAQRAGHSCAFVDLENTFVPAYAEKTGVKLADLYFAQPDDGETAWLTVEALIKGGVRVIVLDSVAAVSPRAEKEGNYGDANMGLAARLNGQAMRKLSDLIAAKGVLLFLINQTRSNLAGYGSSTVLPGGNTFKFYSAVKLKLRPIKKDTTTVRIAAKVEKSKVAPPFGEAEYTIVYGEGIDRASEIVDEAVRLGLIHRRGSWYTYGEVKKQNIPDLVEAIGADFTSIEQEVIERWGS